MEAYDNEGSPWDNSSPGVEDEKRPVQKEKRNNILPLWGNERTMNLNPLILTNIQSSHYFKGNIANSFVGHLLHHSEWCVTLFKGKLEGSRKRDRPRAEFMSTIKEKRTYCHIKQLARENRPLG